MLREVQVPGSVLQDSGFVRGAWSTQVVCCKTVVLLGGVVNTGSVLQDSGFVRGAWSTQVVCCKTVVLLEGRGQHG